MLITDQRDALVDLVGALAMKDQKGEIKMSEYVILAVEEQVNEHRTDAGDDTVPYLQKCKVINYVYSNYCASLLALHILPRVH